MLSYNLVLRTRRVCTWIMELSDDHLRRHSRSGRIVKVLVPDVKCCRSRFRGINEIFAVDRKLAILAAEVGSTSLPVTILWLQIALGSRRGFVCHPLLDFLARYGKQVTLLRMIRAGFRYSKKELRFYHQLPNFKYMHIGVVKEDMKPGVIASTIFSGFSGVPYPDVLSKLSTLHVDTDICGFHIERLLETCTNFETFYIHSYHAPAEEHSTWQNIFDRNHHKKLNY